MSDDPAAPMRRVFIRDLVLQARIGIYPHERGASQRVRINVDLLVAEEPGPIDDRLDRVLDYEAIANRVRAIVAAGHVNLVETLAERIAATCLEDEPVRVARIRVEKLDVFADAVAAGVEIERRPAADRPPDRQSH